MAAAPQSVVDGLRKEFSNIANLKLAADASRPENSQFIDALMQMISGFVSKASQATLGSPPGMAPPGGAPAPGVGGPPGIPPAGGPPPGGGAGLGVGPPGSAPPAVSNNPSSMDEIRRMLTAGVNV